MRGRRAVELKRLLPFARRRLHAALKCGTNLKPRVKTDVCTPDLLVVLLVIDGSRGQGDEVGENFKMENQFADGFRPSRCLRNNELIQQKASSTLKVVQVICAFGAQIKLVACSAVRATAPPAMNEI